MNEPFPFPPDNQYMLDFTNIRDGSPSLDKPENSVVVAPSTSSEGSSTASSDAASPASNGSPADWCFWEGSSQTGLSGESVGALNDDPWSWAKMDLDAIASATDANSAKGIPLALIDPNTLNFEDAFTNQLFIPTQHNNFLPSAASPADILGLPDLLQTLASLPVPPSVQESNLPIHLHSQSHINQVLHTRSTPSQVGFQHDQTIVQKAPLHSPAGFDGNRSQLPNLGDVDEIAMKARQRAGVQVAISSPSLNGAVPFQDPPQKLPIPRLVKHMIVGRPPLAKHLQQSAMSSGLVESSDAVSPIQLESSQAIMGASGRPKTSHTTIERRYRTNLNARITALKHAVPALRILDKNQFPEEKVDERGFVDGVKAARKSSKASVLGKAVEYINVLKNRETRLRRETLGLKSLLSGLVGGPALLREWEAGWLEKYGGEETDEVVLESECDDEEGSDDEDEKPRKKPKISKPINPSVKKEHVSPVLSVNTVTETGKRKRGRPKKISDIPLFPVGTTAVEQLSNSTSSSQMSHSMTSVPAANIPPTAEQSPAKYLLGVFLFFSFFKPSTTSSAHKLHPHGSYAGNVVVHSAASASTTSALSGLSLSYLAHHLHTILSLILIISLLLPFVPRPHFSRWYRATSKTTDDGHLQMKAGSPAEEWIRLRRLLGIGGAVSECAALVARSLATPIPKQAFISSQQQWNAMVVIHLMNDTTLGLSAKWGVAFGLYARRPLNPSASDLCSLALVFRPIARRFAEKLWMQALEVPSSTESDAICLRMSLDDATSLFQRAVSLGFLDTFASAQLTVLSVIAEMLSLEAVKTMAGALFVRAVDGRPTFEQGCMDDGEELHEVAEWVSVVGSNTRHQVKELLTIWNTTWSAFNSGDVLDEPDYAHDLDDHRDTSPILLEEVRDLLSSLALLHRMASRSGSRSRMSSESMTPTPSSKSFSLGATKQASIKLRQLLASSAFEGEEAIAEARDIMVDRLSWHREGCLLNEWTD